MASPHVAGAAAVLFSHKPSATVAEAKAASGHRRPHRRAERQDSPGPAWLNLNAALSSPAIRADTTTTINSHDPDPSVIGEAVTVHHSVASEALAGDAPTGERDRQRRYRVVRARSRPASARLFTAGPKSLTATHTGGDDAYYNPAPHQTASRHEVNRADTTTTITADDPDPSVPGPSSDGRLHRDLGQPQAGTPTGNVTVTDGVDSTATVSTEPATSP